MTALDALNILHYRVTVLPGHHTAFSFILTSLSSAFLPSLPPPPPICNALPLSELAPYDCNHSSSSQTSTSMLSPLPSDRLFHELTNMRPNTLKRQRTPSIEYATSILSYQLKHEKANDLHRLFDYHADQPSRLSIVDSASSSGDLRADETSSWGDYGNDTQFFVSDSNAGDFSR